MSENRNAKTVFLILLTLATIWFGYLIAKPYLKTILSAIVLAVVFYPVHARLHEYIRNAHAASLISTLLVLLLIMVPTTLLVIEIKRELTGVYQALTAMSQQNGDWLERFILLSDKWSQWLNSYVDLPGFDLSEMLREKLQQVSGFLLSQTANAIGNLTSFIVSLIVAFLTLFFLFRDGRSLVRRLSVLIPLQPEQRRNLISGITRTVKASMYGVVAVAVAQGVLMGLAWWFLGLHSPVLWGVLTGLISFIPLVGSSIIWLPAAVILILNGSWVKGLVLIGWGAGVVGLADNVIRPYVISEAVQIHPLLVFFALLGGVQAFGLIGLFAGPVVLAAGQAVFELLKDESHGRAERLPRLNE